MLDQDSVGDTLLDRPSHRRNCFREANVDNLTADETAVNVNGLIRFVSAREVSFEIS